jgi:hypothetical protein
MIIINLTRSQIFKSQTTPYGTKKKKKKKKKRKEEERHNHTQARLTQIDLFPNNDQQMVSIDG